MTMTDDSRNVVECVLELTVKAFILIVSIIVVMSLPRLDAGRDRLVWRGSSDGVFSVKSAYGVISSSQHAPESKLFKLIHRWAGPERIRSFLWKLAHENVLINGKRMRIGISGSDECYSCHNEVESLFHLFPDCRESKQVWHLLVVREQCREFSSCNNWKYWLVINLSNSRVIHGNQWNLLFGVALDLRTAESEPKWCYPQPGQIVLEMQI
ncbi:hypothetical protein JHK85_032189 [Glycine max]|nr:hypothetical protein JHK85_032189 [Glycine max]